MWCLTSVRRNLSAQGVMKLTVGVHGTVLGAHCDMHQRGNVIPFTLGATRGKYNSSLATLVILHFSF